MLEPPREQTLLSLKLFLSSAAAIAAFHVSYLNSSCNLLGTMDRINNIALDIHVMFPPSSPQKGHSSPPPIPWRHAALAELTRVKDQLCGICDRAESATRRLEKLSEEARKLELQRQSLPWWKRHF